MTKGLAVITGASTGIGFELAHLAAEQGYDLLIAADEGLIASAADDLRAKGGEVESLEVDLSSIEGVDRLLEAAGGRRIDLLRQCWHRHGRRVS